MEVAEKAKDFKGSVKRLFKELKSQKVLIFVAVILAIFSAILSIMAPDKLKELTDEISKGLFGTMNMDAVWQIIIFLVSLYVISALFNFIQSLCMTEVANRFAQKLRSRISKKINNLPLKFFDKHKYGDTLSIVTNDVDMVAQTMHNSFVSFISNIVLFFGTLIMMFLTNWIMAITAGLASIVGFVGMFIVLGKSQKYFSARQENLGKLNGHIEEMFSGLNVIKVYNGRKESDEEFDKLNKAVAQTDAKSQFLSGLMPPMMTSPLSQIAQGLTSLQSTVAASERVFEFLDETEMSDEKSFEKVLDKDKVKGKIEFENVVFGYDDSEKPVIKGFSAIANPGQKIAIVG